MRLDVIYRASKNVLSRAERDFYLGYCSFADNETGLCYPKMKTVAERVGIPVQSASRMYKQIIGYGFLERVDNGHRCLVGYSKSSPDVNLSSPQVKLSSPDVNLHIKDRTTHLTTHKTKRRPKSDDSPELVEFRKVLTTYQNSYAKPTTRGVAIANTKAIRELFTLADGDAGRCIRYHEELQAEEFRKGRVDWTTVLKNFSYFGKKSASPAPSAMVGKHDPANEEQVECRTCFDERELIHFPNPNSIEGMERRPCPDCVAVAV